jgi:hypothetical protein
MWYYIFYMIRTTSQVNSPETAITRAETLYNDYIAAAERVDEVALLLAATSMRPTIHERLATIDGHLRKAIVERSVASFACEIDLHSEFPLYQQQAAAMALAQEAIVITL